MVNPANGTASMSVPIATSPGRSGFGPRLALNYDSGSGNGPFGAGWSLQLPGVTRRTDRGVPRYDDTDVFVLSGAEDLVPELAPASPGADWEPAGSVDVPGFRVEGYRPRTEGLFARIERWTRRSDGDTHWRSVTRDNVASRYGVDAGSRVADPADPARVFSWLLCRSEDGRGNAISYEYLAENGDQVDVSSAHESHRLPADRGAARHLKRIRYGNRISTLVDPEPADPGWMFEVVLDYGEHDDEVPTPGAVRAVPCRADPFSSYRAGFEVRTYRLCRRVLMFHHFPAEDGVGVDCLVRSTDLGHTQNEAAGAFLTSVEDRGYRRSGAGYLMRSLPPAEFGYTQATMDGSPHDVDPESLLNLPAGATGHRWADLDGEGISGVLLTGPDSWSYKPNLGAGRLGPLRPVPGMPAPTVGTTAAPGLLDLAGDGLLDVVTLDGPAPGFLARTADGDWRPWRAFEAFPAHDLGRASICLVDLDGDGHPDLLVTEGESLTWYPSLAEAGFGPGITLPTGLAADAGPIPVLTDASRSVQLADMSGDGLADLVQIENGAVRYWPNLGHGRFGRPVTMDGAPRFHSDERFDPGSLRLADVGGSGTTDLIHLGADGVRVHLNRGGNGWAPPVLLPGLPSADAGVTVDAVDLLGTGTTCLVWSSPHQTDAATSMRYADLTGGVKPHLLERVVNNLGAETVVRYAPSTRFCLADRAAGRPWLTRLPFPVQVVERVETYDRVSGGRSVARYAYHHGYFDGVDREFRGFGMTEQWDTVELSALGDVDLTEPSTVDLVSQVPPVLTRTWFHTGAFLNGGPTLSQGYAAEYWQEPGLTALEQDALRLPDTVLPETLLLADGARVPYRPGTEELREAFRALKGSMLRQEVHAVDGSAEQDRPYQVIEFRHAVELLQPAAGGPHAVCLVRPVETVTRHYERRLYGVELADGTVADRADPRVSHELTLEVDGHGAVLRGVSVGYARRLPDADADPLLPAWALAAARTAQTTTHAVLTVNGFTNAVDEPAAYRLPLPAESRGYELVNLPATPGLLRLDELRAVCDAASDGAHDLPYSDVGATGAVTPAPYRRLVENVRTLYRRDDLTGPLPLGQLHPLGLPYQNYRLTFTPDLLDAVYRRELDGAVTDLLPDAVAVLRGEGGYLLGDDSRAAGLFPADDPDGRWWAPSGRLHCSPTATDTPAAELAHAIAHFFVPGRFVDPFGAVTTIHHDVDDLLAVEVRDALGNRTTAGERGADGVASGGGNDYRVLAPRLVSDANRNRSAVAFDALGMVVGTAVAGKPEEQVGDSLDGFDPDPPPDVVAAHLADPLADVHRLLGQATIRVVYDPFGYDRTRSTPTPQPSVAATMARETHVHDLAAAERSRVQHVFAYSDGFGREIQRKALVGPGPLVPDGPETEPRWLGSGWTVFDDKARPVRRYEPFFTATPAFESARAEGVSPVLCYDPLGRVVATLHPDHTFEKTIAGPWRTESWDAADTVLVADPADDPDVGDHVRRLPEAAYLPSWYTSRAGGGMGPLEQAAALGAAAHAGTPTAVLTDPLGRAVLTVAHHRGPGGTAPPDDVLVATHVGLDVEGNQRDVVDAQGRLVLHRDHDMAGNLLHAAGMDTGERWALTDVAGRPRYGWDSRRHRLRTDYDPLGRPTGVHLLTGAGPERLVGRTVFGEDQPDAEARNLLGRPFQAFDGAGVVTTAAFDFEGNPPSSIRQLAADYRTTPDWSSTVELEQSEFRTGIVRDALGRAMLRSTPDGSSTRFRYDEGGGLASVDVDLQGEASVGEPVWTPFVVELDHDAKGQRVRIAYGNGVVTTYEHDPRTFRLVRLLTLRAGERLQDLSYTYDPVGNIVHIADAAQQTLFFRNTVVTPTAGYRYDATYRLVEATGREHLGQLGAPTPQDGTGAFPPVLDHPADGGAMGRYVESYRYDDVDNIVEVRHVGSDPAHPGWTRSCFYTEASLLESGRAGNRLASTGIGTTIEPYTHDEHGNMTSMPHLPALRWDHLDRLQASTGQVRADGAPETTYYTYDAAGQRVRKVTERSAGPGGTPTRTVERDYLGGFELYREYAGDGIGIVLERQTLHVMDDVRRIALVETRTVGDDGSPVRLIRHQLGNHQGTASVELDGTGRTLSYEEHFPYGGSSYRAMDSTFGAAPKRYRYTGKERDEETGLSYHGARYYAPWLGRWTSADPAGLVDGTNLYRYVRNSPVRYSDPSGNDCVDSTCPTYDISRDNSVPIRVMVTALYDTKHAFFNVVVNSPGGRMLTPSPAPGMKWRFDYATDSSGRQIMETALTQVPVQSWPWELVESTLDRATLLGGVSTVASPGGVAYSQTGTNQQVRLADDFVDAVKGDLKESVDIKKVVGHLSTEKVDPRLPDDWTLRVAEDPDSSVFASAELNGGFLETEVYAERARALGYPSLSGGAAFQELVALGEASGEMKGIRGRWFEGTNYDKFKELVGSERTEAAYKAAAFGTFTGQNAAKAGYTEIDRISVIIPEGTSRGQIFVDFVKPKPPPR